MRFFVCEKVCLLKEMTGFMNKKIKKGILIVLAVYVVCAALFCVLANDQIHYNETKEEYAGSSAQSNLGEIESGTVLEQTIDITGSYLRGVQVYFATFSRENTGYVTATVSDDSGNIISETDIDYSELTDNSWYEIEFDSRIKLPEGTDTINLTLEFKDGESGNAITACYQISETDGLYSMSVNGESREGQALCALALTESDTWYGPYCIPFFAVIFLILIAMSARILYCEKKEKKNFVLGIIHTIEKYQFLLEQLINRDFKTKYKRSFFGVLWSLLNPLLTMIVQYVVFSRLFRFNIENYSVYLLTGIVVFNAFNDATTQAMNAIVGNASLITKVYVPKYIYPISKVLSSSINLLLSLIPLFLVAIITGVRLNFTLLLLPFGIVCFVGFVIGLSFILSTLMVYFRDMQFLWGVITMIWMYGTPIIYDMSTISGTFLYPFQTINPMYHYISFFRTIVLEGMSPRPSEYLACFGIAALFIILGSMLFKKCQGKFILHL